MLSSRFDQVDTKLTGFEAKLSSLFERFDSVESEVASLRAAGTQ